MPWSALTSVWARTPDACWDPYLAWADARGFIGLEAALARCGQGSACAAPALRRVPVAFELVPPLPPASQGSAAYKQLRKEIWPPLAQVGTRFASSDVPIELLPLFLDPFVQQHLPRVELCLPVRTSAHPSDRKAFAAALKNPAPLPSASTGPQVFAAVIDDGCAFANAAFVRPGASGKAPLPRIERLWFQEDRHVGVKPAGIGFNKRDLAQALAAGWRAPRLDEAACYAALEAMLRARAGAAAANDWKACMRGSAAHGTHVLDVMAGNPNPLALRYRYGSKADVASSARMIFVQLPRAAVADTSGSSMTTNVFEALAYIGGVIGARGSVVVNLSYGALAGPHDGSTLLEEAIDHLHDSDERFRAIVLPAGNGYELRAHARVPARNDGRWHEMPLQLLPADPTDTFVELWYAPQGTEGRGDAVIDVELVAPDGSLSGPVALGECKVLRDCAGALPKAAVLHVKRPIAGGGKPMVLVAFAPSVTGDATLPTTRHGVWTIRVRNRGGQEIPVDAWIERDDSAFGSGRSRSQAAFLSEGVGIAPGHPHAASSPIERKATLNSFAHGARSLVAAGCSLRPVRLARYSASGPGRRGGWAGADLTAPCEHTPGTALLAAGTRSAQPAYMNGTSVAAAALSRQCINATAIGELPAPDPKPLDPPPGDHPGGIALPDPALRRGRGLLKPL